MEVALHLDPVDTSPEVREAMIRMVREALMNAVRHSSAQTIQVELRDRREGPWARVRDEGIGFDLGDPDIKKKGFGLVSLSERAKALGGETKVNSAPGAGTEVIIFVPRKPSSGK